MTNHPPSGDISAGRDIHAQNLITGIQQNFNLIFQQPFHPPANLAQLRRDYLAYLSDAYRYLDIKGILQVQQVTQQLPLAAVYVPLKAQTQQTGEWLVAGRWLSRPGVDVPDAVTLRRQSEPMLIEAALKTDPAVVVLGDPGAGKSTLLKILALALAEQPDGPLPIVLPLNAYARRLQQRGDICLSDFLGDYYAARQQKLNQVGDLFNNALANEQAVILLDGLDEVQADRTYLVRLVQDFVAEHIPSPAAGADDPPVAGNRIIVTSRIVGYEEAPLAGLKWRIYTLTDFDRADIEQFIGQWTLAFALSVQGDSEPARQTAARERQELLEAIFSRPSVERLAANPLLLTILALIKYTGVTLPEQRVKLYELYLQALIESWNLARSLDQRPVGPGINYEETVQVLAPLALWLRQENPTAGLVSHSQLEDWLADYYRQEWALPRGEARQRGRDFLKSVECYSNLLLERGERQYGFLHLTLEEMLAAKGLAQLYIDDSAAAVALFNRYLADPGWNETLQLAVGAVGILKQQPRQAGALLQQLATMTPAAVAPGYAVTLAGQILLDVGPTAVGRPAAQQVTTALVEAMQAAAGPIRTRRDAGDLLGRLGWRPEPAPDDLLLALLAGAEPDPLDAFRRVETQNGPIWLGKYPVTNRQFGRFLEAGGYERREFWSDIGWAYRNGANPGVERITDQDLRQSYEEWLAKRPAEKRARPYFWDDRDWNTPLAPVVGVSWFETEAYCRWLTQQIGPAAPGQIKKWMAEQVLRSPDEFPLTAVEVRLPLESEWAAAMSGRGDFPWGDEFDPARLNCAEAWAGREFADYEALRRWWNSDEESWRAATTTAVATYPQGVSPTGVWDGSGNVWEWMLNFYDEEQGTRALRGGGWGNIQRDARVSSRTLYRPVNFYYGLGFRVVVAPVILSS